MKMEIVKNYDDFLKDFNEEQRKFLTKKEREAVRDKKLIPQFWWGDIECETPNIVILGKNPRLKIDDELNDLTDNMHFKEQLKANLCFNNRNRKIKDLLITKFDDNMNKPYFCSWWNNGAFRGLNIQNMDNIAIYNLFGYYSYGSSKKMEDCDSYIYQNKGIRNHICQQIKNASYIFILWKNTWLSWKKILNDSDIFDGKKIYVVNEHNTRNNDFLNSKLVTVQELDKLTTDYSDDIKKIFE